jgi:hypothetical protein
MANSTIFRSFADVSIPVVFPAFRPVPEFMVEQLQVGDALLRDFNAFLRAYENMTQTPNPQSFHVHVHQPSEHAVE